MALRRWLPYGTMCFGGLALVIVGCSRSLMCAPNGIALDIDSHILEVSTIYEHGVCEETRVCRWLPSHKIDDLLQEKATLLEHAKDVAASLSIEALVILFWHGCWSLLDEWSASIGLDQPSLELDGELDYTISSWYAVVRKMQAT